MGPYPPTVPLDQDPSYYFMTNRLSGTNHYWLTNEFTDARAMQIALGKLEPFGSNWVTNVAVIAELKMQDYARLTNDNLITEFWTPAEALATKFRARVTFETKSNVSYKIDWTENYVPFIGPPSSVSKSKVVMGTGSEMTELIGEFIPSLTYTTVEVIPGTVEEIMPTVAGSGTPTAGSLRLRLGLGSAGPIRGAGELHIHEALPSSAIATPSSALPIRVPWCSCVVSCGIVPVWETLGNPFNHEGTRIDHQCPPGSTPTHTHYWNTLAQLPSWAVECALPHPALSRWERERRSPSRLPGVPQRDEGGRSFSLSQRERAGVRENGHVVPQATLPQTIPAVGITHSP